jgi:hypothetical protein
MIPIRHNFFKVSEKNNKIAFLFYFMLNKKINDNKGSNYIFKKNFKGKIHKTIPRC